MPSPDFKDAANPLMVVSLKPKAAQTLYMEQTRAMFDEKYPEFAQDDDMYEDFAVQMGRKGFMNALVDSQTGKVKGLVAGVVLGEHTNTACLTYIVTPDNDPVMAKKLLDGTLSGLRKNQNVQGVYIETFKEGQEANPERDSAERKLFEGLGAEVLPVQYSQPLEPESESEVRGLAIRAVYTNPKITYGQKRAMDYAHLESFTKLYDPELEVPANIALLDSYKSDLGTAPKVAKPSPGQKL